jgi:hypothetical protein
MRTKARNRAALAAAMLALAAALLAGPFVL